uniref:Uncharacterized protein n=1 Tax=Cannabis sativa TaxID=3483 RepID=A0A803P420_CANSA
MLEIELRQTREHRDTMAEKWNDSKSKLSRVREEAEKQRLANQKKLEEAKADTKNKVNSIARRTIYQTWSPNPDMEFSFLGEGAEAMLAFCKKSRKEELGEEDEVEVEQEDLS